MPTSSFYLILYYTILYYALPYHSVKYVCRGLCRAVLYCSQLCSRWHTYTIPFHPLHKYTGIGSRQGNIPNIIIRMAQIIFLIKWWL